MSKRLEVLLAIKALIEAALPGAQVLGLENAGAAPGRIPPGGRVVIRAGDPGPATKDLSPLSYNYEHDIPLEVSAYASGNLTAEQVLDVMLGAIGAAIAANRQLGGLVDYLDAIAAETDDIFESGAAPARGANPVLTAAYSTDSPL